MKQIKHKHSGKVLHTVDADTLVEANLTGANLTGADLYGASLRWANLTGADLRGANLREANLYGANLYGANLRGASLYGASLYGANLYGANLCEADCTEADLRGAFLRGADLRGADLYGASLRWANLTGADLTASKLPHFSIAPEEGSFIAWKKLGGGVVAKVLVPDWARRTSNLIGRKCRAEAVMVLGFYGLTGEKLDTTKENGWRSGTDFVYRLHEVARADSYDDDIRIECTHGIHFFLTFKEAQEW